MMIFVGMNKKRNFKFFALSFIKTIIILWQITIVGLVLLYLTKTGWGDFFSFAWDISKAFFWIIV